MAEAAQKSRAERRSLQRLAAKRVILLDEPTRPPSVEELWHRVWYAVFTAPGREWAAREELVAAGYAVFLPVATYWNASRFRVKRQLERPLMGRYEFVGVRGQVNDDTWSAILNTDGVTAMLGARGGNRPVRVPTENLVELAGTLIAGQFDETRDTFGADQAVTITAGPFAGFTGRITAAVPAYAAPDDAIGLVLRIMGRDTVTHIPLADLRKAP